MSHTDERITRSRYTDKHHGCPRGSGASERVAEGYGARNRAKRRDARRVGYDVRRRCLHCIAITARYCKNDVGLVEVFGACGLTVSEKKTEVMIMPTPRAPVEKMRIEAADQRYNQTDSFVYLGGTVSETPDVSAEISRRTRAC